MFTNPPRAKETQAQTSRTQEPLFRMGGERADLHLAHVQVHHAESLNRIDEEKHANAHNFRTVSEEIACDLPPLFVPPPGLDR